MKKKREKLAIKELKDSDHNSLQRFLTESEVIFILHHLCILDNVAVNSGDDNHPPSLIMKLEPTSLEPAIANEKLVDIDKYRITVEIVSKCCYLFDSNQKQS